MLYIQTIFVEWQDFCIKNFQGLWSEFCWFIFKMTTKSWYSCEILQGFQSEFCRTALVSSNSDDYWILQKSKDYQVLVKFFQNLIRILQEILINIPIRKLDDHVILVKYQRYFDQNYFKLLDDHGILVKFFKNFNQNSGGQQFRWLWTSSKNRWPQNSCEILPGFDQNSGCLP